MNLNPFDLNGPQFLLFYAILAIATIIAVALIRRRVESAPQEQINRLAAEVAKDPYQIAFLRGGRAEALRVAIVSLLDRGLLLPSNKSLFAKDPDAVIKVRRPLEKAILGRFAEPRLATEVYYDTVILAEAQQIGQPLEDNDLIAGPVTRATQNVLLFAAAAILWLVAAVKIYVAVSRGRFNIIFLVGMAVIATVVVAKLVRRPRTALGDSVLKHIERLFSPLRQVSTTSTHDLSSELTFHAAVFGMAALPFAISDMFGPLDLQHNKASQGWSSCGSCGSSGGDVSIGSGSSCGGGGCGGGCGGCGD